MKQLHKWVSVWVSPVVSFPKLFRIELFCVVTLLARSAEPLWWQKQEKKQKKKKTLNVQHIFCQIFLSSLQDLHRQTWLKQQWDHHLINDDRHDFDFVGNTHNETHLSSKLEYQLPNLRHPPLPLLDFIMCIHQLLILLLIYSKIVRPCLYGETLFRARRVLPLPKLPRVSQLFMDFRTKCVKPFNWEIKKQKVGTAKRMTHIARSPFFNC